MFHLQYLVPDNFPEANGAWDKEVLHMCAQLKNVDRQFVQVPDSALFIRLKVLIDGASLEIKKRDKLIYINLFCFEKQYFPGVFAQVEEFYRLYKLGVPQKLTLPTWIHSIPVAADLLRDNETVLCQKMTTSYFWAVYGQSQKKRKPAN
jgi:hypothetical protein